MRRRSAVMLPGLLLVLLLAAQPSAVGAPGEASEQDSTAHGYVIVEFADAPAATYAGGIAGYARTRPQAGQRLDVARPEVGRYVAMLQGQHAAFARWLERAAPTATIVGDHTLISNSVVVELGEESAAVLARGPRVRSVTASQTYMPAMAASVELVGATSVWPALGGRTGAGSGVKIGIVDTGIDFSHPSLYCHEDPAPAKVYYSGEGHFDPDLVLAFNHGTHVAGVAAGCPVTMTEGPLTGEISGIAPGASLYDYNVFPGFGGGEIGLAFNHDIIAAVEDTVADGMDVVNLSLYAPVKGPNDNLAKAVDAAVAAGVVMVAAAGNTGPFDASIASPAVAEHAITVGVSTNPHFVGVPLTFNGTSAWAALGMFMGFDPPVTAEYTAVEPALACSPITSDVAGKIALIDRGACTFTTKVHHAEDAGAIGVIVVNGFAGDPVTMVHDPGARDPDISAVMVDIEVGNEMKPSGVVTVGGDPQGVTTDNGDIIAGFSSRGPAPYTARLKPDVTAPGINVTWAVYQGAYGVWNGASFAAPHVTGAAALLLHQYPDWTPADVKSAIVTTAERPVRDHADPSQPTGVLTRGGGRLEVHAASQAPARFSPASVSFGRFDGDRRVRATRHVEVRGDVTCTAAVAGPSIVSVDSSTVSGGDTLTVALDAGKTAQTPTGDYEGDVVLHCDGTELRLPWFVRIDREADT